LQKTGLRSKLLRDQRRKSAEQLKFIDYPMAQKKYPRKGFGSYLLPFILIIVLLGAGWYIIQNNINLSDIQRIFQPPPVAKDEKVTIVYQEGENQIKPWSEEKWKTLQSDAFLQAGDTIKTSPSGLLVLRFFEGSEIRLGKNTEIKLIRLDKNVTEGDHLAVDLVTGQLWRRGMDGNTEEADFTVNTNRQILQMNKAIVIDLQTNPDKLRVIGGNVISNVAEKMNGTRKPISQLEISGGQELTLDDLTMDQLKAGDKDVVLPIDATYLESEWYLWNIEKEEKLGLVIDIAEPKALVQEDLKPLDEGLVLVTEPKTGAKTGGKTLVAGTYDREKISQIWVNNEPVLLGLADEWETSIQLSEQQQTIRVTALEVNSTVKKEVTTFDVSVDNKGPILGKITKPEVDENGNGEITGDTIELVGEIGSDAQRVCIAHNDSTPAYCLKQFVAGSSSYRYLGGVGYGNLVAGRNKYAIYAYDALENMSQKTIFIFKDAPKPGERIEDSSPTPPPETSTGAELSKPVITTPDPSSTFETNNPLLTIKGTVDKGSRTLLINDKKASYTSGSEAFEVTITLEKGENLIRIQTSDALGNKSKTATLTAIYLEEVKEEE
jgi:hypothetical protein